MLHIFYIVSLPDSLGIDVDVLHFLIFSKGPFKRHHFTGLNLDQK